ncbi:MAG: hypothetical protein SNJ59_07600 [Aggregatilineales bacterium]
MRFKAQIAGRLWAGGLALLWLGACLPAAVPMATQPPSSQAEDRGGTIHNIAAAQPEATPTFEEAAPPVTPTPAGMTLRLWWPEPLAPVENEDAADLLSELIGAFRAANPNVMVDFRLKQVDHIGMSNVGSLLATLRSASAVAPGALPHVTLMRRSDLLEAASLGLLQPLRIPAAISGDVQRTALELGRIGEQVYGLPYMLDVEHMAFTERVLPPARWAFDDVLASDLTYVFPAGRVNVLSNAFLAQYLTAGPDLLVGGELIVDAAVLRTVYTFYEQAVAAGVIDASVLEYIRPEDYGPALLSGLVDAGIVTSTLYGKLRARGLELGFGLIPTTTGEAITVLDGWMWVITTPDISLQEVALRFIEHMMQISEHEAYARAVRMVPAQRTALRGAVDLDYAAFVDNLVALAILPLPENASGTVARAMQSGLASVIAGQRTADEATRDVIAQLSG